MRATRGKHNAGSCATRELVQHDSRTQACDETQASKEQRYDSEPLDCLQQQHTSCCREMSTGEDDDVKLQRASTALLADLEHLLPRLLRTRKDGLVKVRLMHYVCGMVCFLEIRRRQILTPAD